MKARWLPLSVVLVVSLPHATQELVAAGLDQPPGHRKAHSPVFTVQEIPPPPAFDYLEPKRINSRGDVVGNGDASIGVYADEPHAALYQNGRTVDLHLLLPPDVSHSSTLALDLNDRGQAIFTSPSGPETFLYDRGRVIDLEKLTHQPQLQVLGINVRGQLVGSRGPFDGDGDAFLYHQGRLSLLEDRLGSLASYAYRISNSGFILAGVEEAAGDDRRFRSVVFGRDARIDLGPVRGVDINNAGHVVTGFNTTADARPGWLWAEGTWVELPFNPAALNDHDQVVGRVGPWPHHAVWHFGGETWDLNDLIDPDSGWVLFWANDVNNGGQIAGVGKRHGHLAGFLLRPRHGTAPPRHP